MCTKYICCAFQAINLFIQCISRNLNDGHNILDSYLQYLQFTKKAAHITVADPGFDLRGGN